ncbi:unnamed protein product, partial [Amoebophrya sp. A25]
IHVHLFGRNAGLAHVIVFFFHLLYRAGRDRELFCVLRALATADVTFGRTKTASTTNTSAWSPSHG